MNCASSPAPIGNKNFIFVKQRARCLLKMNEDISKEKIFSNKNLREQQEIAMFLEKYNTEHDSDFIVFQKRDKPDYFIKNSQGSILGIELSSVYMDDTVVGTEHKKNDLVQIPYDSNTHQAIRNQYFDRILMKIKEKAKKVSSGQYDTTYPIILALYLNDYYMIHIDDEEWAGFLKLNNEYFPERKEFETVFLYK